MRITSCVTILTVGLTAPAFGVNFNSPRAFLTGDDPISIAVADLNGDGKPDLAIADEYTGVSILLGNGNGTFRPPVNYVAGTYCTAVAVGDFNGDGIPT